LKICKKLTKSIKIRGISMKCYKIHLIKHGATKEIEEKRFLGVTDVSLSEKGRDNLEKMAKKYTYPSAQIVYSSPLKRCTETADILYPDRFQCIIPELREYNFGLFDGKNPEELKDNKAFLSWIENKMKDTPPLGESNEEFTKRCMAAINAIVSDMQKRGVTSAAAVTHGGVITRLMCIYNIEKSDPREYFCAGGEGFTVMITPSHWQRDGIFEVMNIIPEKEEEKADFGFYNL
jgi:alpha-ribazole phosphatase